MSRPTSRSPPWARSCTPSTSGCRADQLAWIVNHAADRVVIVNGSLLPLLAPLLPQLHDGRARGGLRPRRPLRSSRAPRAQVHEYEELLAGKPTTYDWPELDERQAAAMCYTSGTTGDPKGVVYCHRSIYLHSMQVNMAQSMGLTDADTSLVVVPQFHVNAWGLPHATFMTGVNMLMPDRFLQPAPARRDDRVASGPRTRPPSPPSGRACSPSSPPSRATSPPSTQVTIGGSACPPSLMEAFDELRHAGLPRLGHDGDLPARHRRPPAGPRGRHRRGVRLPPHPGPLPRLRRGPARRPRRRAPARGTASRPASWRCAAPGSPAPTTAAPDAEPLRPDDKFSADGWLKTGDVGTITADGFLTLTDRAKDVIKSGGEWISSVELENALMAHPDVAEAAVVAVPDEKWGERPLATVVLKEGADRRLRVPARLPRERAQIAKWQLPERWAIIEAVPKTSVGQVRQEGAAQAVRGRETWTSPSSDPGTVATQPGTADDSPARSAWRRLAAAVRVRRRVDGSPRTADAPPGRACAPRPEPARGRRDAAGDSWCRRYGARQLVPIRASRSTIRPCTSALVDRSARNSTVSPDASRGRSAGSTAAV